MSKVVHALAIVIPKFYIAPYGNINHKFVNLRHYCYSNLSYSCDMKSGLKVPKMKVEFANSGDLDDLSHLDLCWPLVFE